jgi:hypothetical protein
MAGRRGTRGSERYDGGLVVRAKGPDDDLLVRAKGRTTISSVTLHALRAWSTVSPTSWPYDS